MARARRGRGHRRRARAVRAHRGPVLPGFGQHRLQRTAQNLRGDAGRHPEDAGVAAPHDSVPARDLLFRLRLTHPEVTVAWADSAYGGPLIGWSRSALGLTLKTVPRRKDQDGFSVLAKRWRVERAISWIMRARRNVRDYERLISHSEAHLTWAFITLMVRRLTRPPRPPRAAPHPVEPVKTADIPKPIRIRMQPHNSIRLAPAALR
ncbi:transposase [Streptomyces sp. NPDC054951]